MTALKLIACDALVGLPRKPFPWLQPDAADLGRELDRLTIARVVVRHRQCLENAPHWGNTVLAREAATEPRWIPAHCFTPDGAPDAFSPAAEVTAALAAGTRVGWMSPKEHMFSPRPWCAGRLYAELAARRVPLLVDYRQLAVDEIDEVMTAHPMLRLVLLTVPRLGRNRNLYALLARHPELRLCVSFSYSVHEGVEDLVAKFGPDRWVWGSGYPEAEGGASVALLTYSAIAPEARALIAHGNIERLLAEVVT